MTAYEASDLLNGVISNQLAGQALFITLISGYVAVAYVVGAKLTKYQVSFVNFAFVLFILVGLFGSAQLIDMVYEYSAMRANAIPGKGEFQSIDNLALWMTTGVRLVMVAGALLFMWQVRHPKTQ